MIKFFVTYFTTQGRFLSTLFFYVQIELSSKNDFVRLII